MKRIIVSLSVVAGLLSPVLAQQQAPIGFVYAAYQDCLYYVEDSTENKERELLACINEELEYREYSTFSSLQAVKDYIKNYNPEDESDEER